MTTIEEIQRMGTTMKEVLGLTGSAIGVRLLTTDEPVPGAVPATGHRYCQALMRARHGDHVFVDATGFAGAGPCGTVTGILVSQASDNLTIDDE